MYLQRGNISATENISAISIHPGYQALEVAIPVVYGCIIVLGLLGNGLVIFVTIKRRSSSSVPSVYVLNLAVADFLFMIALSLLLYQHAFNNWIFGPVICKLAVSFDGLNQFTSVYTLTLMSIDRYLAIAHALRSISFRTVHNARVICFFTWVFSAVFVLPLWMYGDVDPQYNGTVLCKTNWPYPEFEIVFVLYTFVLGFVLPLFIIIASYACMLRYLVITKRPSSTRSTSRNESKRVAVLVFAIVAAFVVCWLPFYVVHLTGALTGIETFAMTISFVISICLSYANSCINPLIYTFIGRRFRMGFLPIPDSECCRKGREKRRRRVRRTLSTSSDMYGSRRSSNSQRVLSWKDRLTVVESVTYEETTVVGNHQDESSV
ncbi:somatostatin receptor type 5-like isoform X2 [Ptychodera flava]|uniref:somatostatin receptor type 5-like isoform X2 n=1 Tax=Ptychodera flava TaxID=63121 RepID=UPI00396A8395